MDVFTCVLKVLLKCCETEPLLRAMLPDFFKMSPSVLIKCRAGTGRPVPEAISL